jgi:hypothetical protein
MGHGRTVCRICKKVLQQCRCIENHTNVTYTVCQDCSDAPADKINPDHYKHATGVQCVEIAECLNFNLGNALKYIWRSGKKGGEPVGDDLTKAAWYIQRELMRLNDPQASLNFNDLVPVVNKVLMVIAHERDSILGRFLTLVQSEDPNALRQLLDKLPVAEVRVG